MRDYRLFFGGSEDWDNDMVAVGGDFSVDRLLYAYTHGIFPWSESPIRWFSPDPRAIFDINGLHISRSLKKKIKKRPFKIKFNTAFSEVMEGCAYRTQESTWITDGFKKGYKEMFENGYCHSVEAWNNDRLVGGVYGVSIGRFFAGESMFTFETDAGKIALAYLFSALKRDRFELFDTQYLNETTWNLGAYEIPRVFYLDLLKDAVRIPYKWLPPSIEEVEDELLSSFMH
jgi:leucyl/phenylalanyl-tRNA---protein transferase